MKRKSQIITQAIIVSLVLIINNNIAMANTATGRIETPDYRVVKKIDRIEIRQYPVLITASTVMGSSYSGNSANGFRKVAGYIFGGNNRNESISMTSPVMVEMSDTMKMSFIMPSKYELKDLPIPNNQDVTIESQGPMTIAVITYPGYNNDSKMEKYKKLLSDKLKESDIQFKGDFMFFGYNPPYKFFNRKNEIAVEIEFTTE